MKTVSIACGVLLMCAGIQSAQASTTTYNVTQTFNQVVYNSSHPTWDTVFTGSFSFDTATNTVSNLMGSLSQAMTGNVGSRQLNYQLSSVYDAVLGGLLITSFHQNSTDVFSNSGGVSGVTGWATGGSKSFGNQNAYSTIFVNVTNPTAALTTAQIGKLAYADCTTGSLMGKMNMCMTGYINPITGLQGGTMQGTFPISQTISAAVPEPETYAMLLAGLGLMGSIVRRRKAC